MDNYEKIVSLWKGYNIKSVADIDKRLDNFRVLFAYNSGKIENCEITYHDTRELFENGKVLNYSGTPRSIFELENQRICYEFLKPEIIARIPITLDFIREVHAILTSGTYDERRFIEKGERPGHFKKNDYVIGEAEVGSLPEDVESDLVALLNVLTEYEGKDVLKMASYFHARFEYIHPFADGNGRVGRTLLNYYLMIHDHPPLIVYDEEKEAYYDALAHYDQSEELEPTYLFLRAETEKTWKKAWEREQRRKKDARD